MYTPNDIRQKYLQFFSSKGHKVIPSSPLVPDNDPTTLFTGSGMQPMVPYLLGQPHPLGTRITDSQKCFRSQDIEEVGDNRHTTFFEMLGNWSLGDYFKQEQLRWFFEFLIAEIGLEPERIFVSVFSGDEEFKIARDEESAALWQQLFDEQGIQAKIITNASTQGMQGGRIFYYNEAKNWWSRSGGPSKMPVGEPGGPDSEVFYDFGAELQLHEMSSFKNELCHVNCDCGRFLEIGNSVFMQYVKTESGFEPLPAQNVDFGGGLERIAAVSNSNPDVFTTDGFTPIINKIEALSGKSYQDISHQYAFRVIADHLRAAVMLAADGIYPSSKAQGYFARRLVRRAIRYAKQLGIEQAFLADSAAIVARMYRESYPEVQNELPQIQTQLSREEAKFQHTLEKGLRELEKIDNLTGETAFKLYETYGFPFELTQEIALEKGQKINVEEFKAAQQQHAQESRTASAGMFKGGLADHSEITTQYHTATHLLHAALRKIVGNEVQQKGSNITVERLRFDFSFGRALTPLEKQQVEQQINDWIAADLPVTRQVLPKQAALDSGATAFFIEKYPAEVSVYTIGQDVANNWISKEFCGGPHIERTGVIGKIHLIKEQSASAGVRRIYMELD